MSSPFFTLFKKPINSISDEITTKFKTPFFTTYVTVWGIKNNLFVYNLFFNNKIVDKTNLLQTQFNFSEFSFYKNIFLTLFISLAILIGFYIFLNISRSITIFSEERIKLNLLDKLRSRNLSSIEDTKYWKNKSENLNKKSIELEKELDILRSSNKFNKTELEKQKDILKKTINECDDFVLSFKKITEGFSSSYSESKDSRGLFEDLIKDLKQEQIRFENFKKSPTFIKS